MNQIKCFYNLLTGLESLAIIVSRISRLRILPVAPLGRASEVKKNI